MKNTLSKIELDVKKFNSKESIALLKQLFPKIITKDNLLSLSSIGNEIYLLESSEHYSELIMVEYYSIVYNKFRFSKTLLLERVEKEFSTKDIMISLFNNISKP